MACQSQHKGMRRREGCERLTGTTELGEGCKEPNFSEVVRKQFVRRRKPYPGLCVVVRMRGFLYRKFPRGVRFRDIGVMGRCPDCVDFVSCAMEAPAGAQQDMVNSQQDINTERRLTGVQCADSGAIELYNVHPPEFSRLAFEDQTIADVILTRSASRSPLDE